MKSGLFLAIAFAIVVMPLPVKAAEEEIQVYLDDMASPGHFGVDIHNNYVVSGDAKPEYPGAQPPQHVYRLTPEFYYGLTPHLEFGTYLLTTTAPGDFPNFDGAKLRLKFIAPKKPEQSYFWGANFECGRTSKRVAINPWNAELKGILGVRKGRWLLATNSNLDWSVSGPVNEPATFEQDSKISYRVKPALSVGMESYNGLGPARRFATLNQQPQGIYAVLDWVRKRYDLNFGVGYGLTSPSDRWVLKAIIGMPIGH